MIINWSVIIYFIFRFQGHGPSIQLAEKFAARKALEKYYFPQREWQQYYINNKASLMNRTQKDNRDHGKLSSKLASSRVLAFRLKSKLFQKHPFQPVKQIESASGNIHRTKTCLRSVKTRASGRLILACLEASSNRGSAMASGAPPSIRSYRTRLRTVLTQAVLTAKAASTYSSASFVLC